MVGESLPVRAAGIILSVSAQSSATRLPLGRVVFNVAGYQAVWLASIQGAAHARPWLGPILVALMVGIELSLSARPMQLAALMAIASVVGFGQETLMFKFGLVTYPHHPDGVPLWMLALWPLFATTLPVSLRALQSRPLIAALVGALFAPLAYSAGRAAGAIALPDTPRSLAVLAAAWMVVLPALLEICRRLERAPRAPDGKG